MEWVKIHTTLLKNEIRKKKNSEAHSWKEKSSYVQVI